MCYTTPPTLGECHARSARTWPLCRGVISASKGRTYTAHRDYITAHENMNGQFSKMVGSKLLEIDDFRALTNVTVDSRSSFSLSSSFFPKMTSPVFLFQKDFIYFHQPKNASPSCRAGLLPLFKCLQSQGTSKSRTDFGVRKPNSKSKNNIIVSVFLLKNKENARRCWTLGCKICVPSKAFHFQAP